ncbi:MAG TPA: Plug domain-containing protein, partial [Gemmatimonadota bacterium]|nr:Plug domain-containing protein [Gemmatimonadota bacterium]
MRLRAAVLAGVLAGLVLAPGSVLARPPAARDTVPGAPPDTSGAHSDTVPAAAPDTVPGDTVRADTVHADSVPADTARADTAAAPEAPPFPEELEPSATALAVDVHTWDRSQILASASQSLLDFLEWELPGLTALRVGYFGGPHVVQDGALGAGFLELVVDGRPLDALEGSTPDLLRISLAQVQRIRVLRGADHLRIEVTTLHHGREPAYSSIQGGAGRPSLNVIRGAFANGLGSHVQLAGAGDFLDVSGGPTPANWTDGWAKVSWMPSGGRVGLEVRGRSQSVERTLLDDEKFSRSQLEIHGRADPASWLQVDAWAARERRTPDASDSLPTVTDDQGSLTLTAAGSTAFGRATVLA